MPCPQRLPVLALLLFWSVTSLVAYSIAGEKMPWLTVHIALPMLLAAGWGLGFLVDTTTWAKDRQPLRPAGAGAPAGLLHQRTAAYLVRCWAPTRPSRATPSNSCSPPASFSFR